MQDPVETRSKTIDGVLKYWGLLNTRSSEEMDKAREFAEKEYDRLAAAKEDANRYEMLIVRSLRNKRWDIDGEK